MYDRDWQRGSIITPTTLAPGESAVRPPVNPRLISAAEFMDNYVDYTELEEGRIVELTVPHRKHGSVNFEFILAVGQFNKDNQLGRAFTRDTFVVTKSNPDSVRGMDFAFISYKRWPKDVEYVDGPVPMPPDLIAEIRSPTDRPGAVNEKVNEYLAIGVPVVAVIDLKAKVVTVHRNQFADR